MTLPNRQPLFVLVLCLCAATVNSSLGQDTWSQLADMPSGRKSISWSTVSLGGHVYVVGGLDEAGLPSHSLLRYDPLGDEWTERAPMPEALWRATAAEYDGQLYVFGGYTATDRFPFGATSRVYVYSPDSDSWARLANAPRPRGTAAAVSMDDGIHILGGVFRADYAFHDVYHPESDTWSPAAPLPTPRSGLAAVRRGTYIHVVGGYRIQGGVVAQDVHEVYDAETGSWTTAAPLPHARFGVAGGPVTGDRIAVFGGGEAPGGTRVAVYDAHTDAWTWAEEMPDPASFMGVAPIPDGLLVIGGGADGLAPMDDARTSTRLLRFTPHETTR